MPLFSLRNQLWGGMNLEPGDLMPSPIRDHRVLCEGKYAMAAPEGHHIERAPGTKKWVIVPDGKGELSSKDAKPPKGKSKAKGKAKGKGKPEPEDTTADPGESDDSPDEPEKASLLDKAKGLLGGSRDE